MNLMMNTKRVKYLLFYTLFLLLLPVTALSQQVQFEEVTSTSGMVMSYASRWSTGMAWGDYNNDGYLDVYVTSWGQASTGEARNALYRNTGSGIFQNAASSAGVDLNDNSISAAWGDFDNDGDLDLFVANFSEGDVVFQNMLTETGTANFVDVTTATSFFNESVGRSKAAVWGDFDNDGFLDLYVAKYWGKNALYQNNGGSSFTLLNGVFADIRDSEYATWVDYDDDGDVDLYVVNREQENRFYRNDDGEFTTAYIGLNDTQFGRFAAWADYDNNNMLDLFLGNIGANSLYQQAPGGIFTEVAEIAGIKSAPNAWDTWGAAWGDYDGDGDLDLFFVGGFDEVAASESFTGTFGNILLENNGGTFADRTIEADLLRGAMNFYTTDEVGSFASAAAFADYDNDGDPDLMITNTYQNLLFKNLNPTNNYLKVRVQGKGGGFNNRNGLGAKVRVYNINNPGVVIAMQEITSGPQPMMAIFSLSQSESYNVEVTFLKQGAVRPQEETIESITVPLDTLIIQK